MKREEQIRMLLHPERYTDEQVDQMLNEAGIPTPDAEEQWQRFQMMHTNAKRRWMRVAATFIGVLMLSGIAWAAWQSRGQRADAGQEQVTSATELQPVETTGDIVRFDNVPLDSVLAVVARHYHKQVECRNETVRNLHFHIEWNQAAPLRDFITLINNFEGVSLREEQDTIIAE